MLRAAIVAATAIIVTALTTQATAQSGTPVRTLGATPSGGWTVVQVGEQTINQCLLGMRSDAPAPTPGQPQFMISADNDFAVLRVRAAEWSFGSGGQVAVTLVTADGEESTPTAFVRGADLIDIAFAATPDRISELAQSSELAIRSQQTTIRLPLAGLSQALPAYRDCLARISQPPAAVQAALEVR
jgi:hypothetical protein